MFYFLLFWYGSTTKPCQDLGADTHFHSRVYAVNNVMIRDVGEIRRQPCPVVLAQSWTSSANIFLAWIITISLLVVFFLVQGLDSVLCALCTTLCSNLPSEIQMWLNPPCGQELSRASLYIFNIKIPNFTSV